MAIMEPLNLQQIYVNTLSGNYLMFTFLAIIAMAVFAAKFRMNNVAMLSMFAFFGIIMSIYIGGWLVVPIIVVVGALSAYALSRIWD